MAKRPKASGATAPPASTPAGDSAAPAASNPVPAPVAPQIRSRPAPPVVNAQAQAAPAAVTGRHELKNELLSVLFDAEPPTGSDPAQPAAEIAPANAHTPEREPEPTAAADIEPEPETVQHSTQEEEPEGVPAPPGIEEEGEEENIESLAQLSEDDLDNLAEERNWTPVYAKRVRRMCRQHRRMAAEIDSLRAERDELKSKAEETPAGGSAQAPRGGHAQQLEDRIATLENNLDTLEAHPDGYTITDEQGRQQTFTPEQVRRAKVRLNGELAENRVLLKQHTQEMARQRDEFARGAREEFPFLKDKTSQQSRFIAQVCREFPGVTEMPGFIRIISGFCAYEDAKRAKANPSTVLRTPSPVGREKDGMRANGNGNGNGHTNGHSDGGRAQAPLPPARPPGRSTAPPRISNQAAQWAEAEKDFSRTGSMKDGKRLIEAALAGSFE